MGNYFSKWTETKHSHKNSLIKNVNEVEKHNLTYKIHIKTKINNKKIETLKCKFLKQNDECITYEHFSSQMRKLNNETRNYCT